MVVHQHTNYVKRKAAQKEKQMLQRCNMDICTEFRRKERKRRDEFCQKKNTIKRLLNTKFAVMILKCMPTSSLHNLNTKFAEMISHYMSSGSLNNLSVIFYLICDLFSFQIKHEKVRNFWISVVMELGILL